MRLLVVTPRYGDVAGGAERALRGFATRCCDGFAVEVATTCAVDHHGFANELAPGTREEDGLVVHRFPVTRGPLPGAVGATYLGQLRALARSVWSAPLQRFVAAEAGRFDAVLLAPYLLGTTFWSAAARPDRCLLVPCLHDEPEARTAPMRALLAAVRGCLFLTRAEEHLARSLAPVRGGRVVGVGVDAGTPVPADAVAAVRARLGLDRPYLAAVGRVEEAKGVDVLVARAAAARAAGLGVDLVLAGDGPYRAPAWVRCAGFLAEQERRALVAGAVASVSASRLESFSLVLLEAWSDGVPTLFEAGCPPVVEHTGASGGGLLHRDARTFAAGVERLLDPGERARLGEAGRAYVDARFRWPAVRGRFRSALEELACAS